MTYNKNAIKKLRKKHNLTQHRFAQKINAQAQNISAWENGTCIPSLRYLEAIINAFGVDCNYFFKD